MVRDRRGEGWGRSVQRSGKSKSGKTTGCGLEALFILAGCATGIIYAMSQIVS